MRDAVAALVVAALTLVVLAQPGPSVAQGEECTSDATFVTDVTVPDDTVMEPGEKFTKTWRLSNNATCDWTEEYSLDFVQGRQLGAASPQVLTEVVKSGETTDLSIQMQLPEAEGTFTSWWQLRDDSGDLFGSRFYVRIVVQETADPIHRPPGRKWESETADWSLRHPSDWYVEGYAVIQSARGVEFVSPIASQDTVAITQIFPAYQTSDSPTFSDYLADQTEESISEFEEFSLELVEEILEIHSHSAGVWTYGQGGIFSEASGVITDARMNAHTYSVLTSDGEYHSPLLACYLSPIPISEDQLELLGEVLSTVTLHSMPEATTPGPTRAKPTPTPTARASLSTDMQGIDASRILNSTIGEIEAILGEPIDAFSISIGSLPHLPNGGESRMYKSGKYTFYIDYDRNGKAKGFQVISGLSEEGHKLKHWGVVLTTFGMDVYLPPDVAAPLASHWYDFQGYKISLDADPKSKNVAMVSITENP